MSDASGKAAPLATLAMDAALAHLRWDSSRSAVAALVAFDRRANLPLISVPTLVITGALDKTAAPEVARKMAERIPGALLLTVPGAGHLLPMEQPAAFNTALLAFLARR